MKRFLSLFSEYIKKTDMLLLSLCVVSTIYGIILISSTTRDSGGSYVFIQAVALLLGILLFFMFSIIDVDILADKWKLLFIFNILFIASLFLFGEAGDSGNRAWIRFGGIGIQPAEVVKIPFIILLAKQILYLKNNRGLNHILSVAELVVHFLIMFGLIILASSDLGSALVYLFIFVVMLFIGGLILCAAAQQLIVLAYIGFFLYCTIFFFQLVTLPVEFNASRRAMAEIAAGGTLTEEERSGARRVLTAAALTYVAAMLTSLLQVLRLLSILRRNDRDR